MNARQVLTRTTLKNHRKGVLCIVIHKKDDSRKKKKKEEETLAASGFIVRAARGNRRALVMTCNHVAAYFVPPGDKLGIRAPGLDQELECEILYQDTNKDLAIIAVFGMPENYPALIFSSETTLTIGTDAVLVAYYTPDKLEETNNPIPIEPGACPGSIVGPKIRETKEMDWKERMRHDCKSMSGCSGGPVIANGRVVGVQQDGDVQQGYAANFVTVEAVVREWAGLEDGQAADSTLEDLFELLRD
ncbi:uncharacterized protein LOC119311041 [Triticum dicoccoides]|uniref:uncharacterized protein LOC119311041 n=1 Tax=Triticum dicoccoides TaxID=85692 RepID=UPI0008438774|nr:uncharacterized protein LOC119311041 [Triticum dicoccoides]XP_037442559.1 uncharacterized protein LOC119311041 [Triticum dicoccoides]XP_037442560.1 uncharacterized protein LOC119311041 [Triticum dicoccoides]XP_044389565.1 uncharacterized protein LOC123112605 [Triticum aestivum]XP_044389566.1 uncharacterized protein LOC123112605 [Triticum aestivum]XP_044389567.1 uncharacterized protein LOC123112605 [Triticum aestivum]XP_044389568.1 uncharacterized protein LOC123112605 [Triticum aestivum]XP